MTETEVVMIAAMVKKFFSITDPLLLAYLSNLSGEFIVCIICVFA